MDFVYHSLCLVYGVESAFFFKSVSFSVSKSKGQSINIIEILVIPNSKMVIEKMKNLNKGELIYKSKYLQEMLSRDFCRSTGATLFVIIVLFFLINGFVNEKPYAQLGLNITLFFTAFGLISLLIMGLPNRIIIFENGFSTSLKSFHVISKEEEFFSWSNIDWIAYKRIRKRGKNTNEKNMTSTIAFKGNGKNIRITISIHSRNQLLLQLKRNKIPIYLVKYISPKRVYEDPDFPCNVIE